jgi:hypothetical protein
MNNQPEHSKQDLDISPDEFRFLSELLDASHSQRCEHSEDLAESLTALEVI